MAFLFLKIFIRNIFVEKFVKPETSDIDQAKILSGDLSIVVIITINNK